MGWLAQTHSKSEWLGNKMFTAVGVCAKARIALTIIAATSVVWLAFVEAPNRASARDIQAQRASALQGQPRAIDRMAPDFAALASDQPAAATQVHADGIAEDTECEPAWHPFISGGEIGVSRTVRALTVWNGDLIAGGSFTTAGGQEVNRIARWDGSKWHPFTSGGQIGVNNHIHELTVWNGDLIAGGAFATAGGQTVNGIARWDGSAWHPFTSGGQIGGCGSALVVWNGDLIAGCGTMVGGQTVNYIARWDGSAWHPFASGGEIGVGGGVATLTVWNSDLIAAGSFTTAGGQTVNRIARWDGSAWHPMTSGGQIGVSGGPAYALTVWNGDLIAGGWFTSAGGQTVNTIARWDGAAWHPFTSGGGIGLSGGIAVYALTVWNGDLIAGGLFTTAEGEADGQTVNHIVRWDGSAWHPFTSGGQIGVGSTVHALKVWNGHLIAGGDFLTAGGHTFRRIARWDGCLAGEPEPPCPGDLTGGEKDDSDGVVNGFDVVKLLSCWGPVAPGCEAADLTGGPQGEPDGVVNGFDLVELLSNWGPCE